MTDHQPDLRLVDGAGGDDALFRAAIETVLARTHGSQCDAFAPLAATFGRSQFWRAVVDVVLALDRDPEHADRLTAMRTGRHPAGRNRYLDGPDDICRQTPAG